MSIVDISDHMARVCECGCVRFNLLRSGRVECDNCQQKQPNLQWRIEMNHNYQPDVSSVPFTAIQISEGMETIKKAIRTTQQCFWADIMRVNAGKLSGELLLEASRQLQKNKEIRLREDSMEHDMEYILVRDI